MSVEILRQELSSLQLRLNALAALRATDAFSDVASEVDRLAKSVTSVKRKAEEAGRQLEKALKQTQTIPQRVRLPNAMRRLRYSLSKLKNTMEGASRRLAANQSYFAALSETKALGEEISKESETIANDLEALEELVTDSFESIADIDDELREFGEDAIGEIESEIDETIDEIQSGASDAFDNALSEISDSLEKFEEIDDLIFAEVADVAAEAVAEVGEEVVAAQVASQAVSAYSPQLATFRAAAETARDIVQAAKGG